LSTHLRLFDWGWASPSELRFECDVRTGDLTQARAVVAEDIYEYAQGVSLHRGFGEREFEVDGRLFRRAASHARFSSYRPTRLPGGLFLDVGAEAAVELRVTTASGAVVAAKSLEAGQRATTQIPEPNSTGRETYELRVIGRSRAGPEEGLRVYGLRRVGIGQTLRRLFRPLAPPRVDFLHTNACGDFTLMHRDHWFRLRGYPEWEAYSMNIDGFLCYAAHADGLQEVVLRDPMRIYHIEHGLGSGWSPEGERKLYQRITSRGITWIERERVLEMARRMYQRGPLITNDEHWGLEREILGEAAPGGDGGARVTGDESRGSGRKGV
jgi:hypothetical protein